MKTLELDEAPEHITKVALNVNEEPVVLTTDGKPVAVLLSIDDVDLETLSVATNPKFLAIIERSRARLRAEGGISTEEMRRRLGLVDPEAEAQP